MKTVQSSARSNVWRPQAAALRSACPTDRPGGEVDDGDAALHPVAYVEGGGVPADVEAVGANAGLEEADLGHGLDVHDRHSVSTLVGHVEDGAVRAQLDVDGQPAHVRLA